MVRWMAWLDEELKAGRPHTECTVAQQLERYRKLDPLFVVRRAYVPSLSPSLPPSLSLSFILLPIYEWIAVLFNQNLKKFCFCNSKGVFTIRDVQIGGSVDFCKRIKKLIINHHPKIISNPLKWHFFILGVIKFMDFWLNFTQNSFPAFSQKGPLENFDELSF